MSKANVESTQQQPTPPLPTPLPDPPRNSGAGTPTHFIDVHFTGFEPVDEGVSSLFRLWRGRFVGKRSDGQEFSVRVSFKQSDTPTVTGPVVQGALESLMGYARCGCKPSKQVICPKHQEAA